MEKAIEIIENELTIREIAHSVINTQKGAIQIESLKKALRLIKASASLDYGSKMICFEISCVANEENNCTRADFYNKCTHKKLPPKSKQP